MKSVYSTKKTDIRKDDINDAKDPLTGDPPVAVAEKVSGKGHIETYTVIYKKDGTPDYTLIYGKMENGVRFIANSNTDSDSIMALTTENQVGQPVQLRYDEQKKRNVADLL